MKHARHAVLLLVFVLFLLGGLWRLFYLRFETGDVYPAYSSLRSDPLGTMIFFESVDRLDGIEAIRDFSSRNRLPGTPGSAYLHLAAESEDWAQVEDRLLQEIERFVTTGGRLIVAFRPEPVKPSTWTRSPAVPAPVSTNTPAKGRRSKGLPMASSGVPIQVALGLGFDHVPLPEKTDGGFEGVQVENETDLPLPESLEWHSGLVLTNLSPSWRTIFSRRGSPVVAERPWGKGAIICMTDCYVLSNEALSAEPQAAFLAWIISTASTVYFDEAHLGIVEQTGVSGLILKYRLHGLAFAFLLLAGLFIWKSSSRFVPPLPPEMPPGHIAGRDSSTAFVNLLRRNIRSDELLKLCFDQWTGSMLSEKKQLISRVDKAQELLEIDQARHPRHRQPVQTYRQICEVLNNRK